MASNPEDLLVNANMNNSNVLSLYMDQTINNALIRELRQITQKFNMKNLITIMFLMGIDNLKKHVNNILSNGPHYLYRFLKFLKSKFFKKKNEELNIQINLDSLNEDDYNKNKYCTTSVNVSEYLEDSLVEFLIRNYDKGVRFDKNVLNYSALKKDKFKYETQLSNISIKFNDYLICIPYDIEVKYVVKKNEYSEFSMLSNDKLKKEYKLISIFLSITGLSYNEIFDASKIIYDHIDENFIKNSNTVSEYMKMFFKDNENLDKYKKLIIMDNRLFNGKYNTIISNSSSHINQDLKIIEILLVAAIIAEFIIEFSNNHVLKKNLLFYGCTTGLKDEEEITKNDRFDTLHELYLKCFPDKEKRHKIYSKRISNNEFQEKYNLNNSSKKNKILEIQIYNDNTLLSSDESLNISTEFINYLYSEKNKQDDDSKVGVYNINIDYDENIIQEFVPAKRIVNKNGDSVEEILIPETPEIKKRILKINTVEINSIYKDFSTLYLKKDDEFKLKSILTSFSKKKNIYKKLGIPFKFGCMLYGEPGTGKSSAITSIASYLMRDIYYLDISKVKTNEELTKIFQDINEQTKESGIIVMEDIDCMTDIVLQRDETHTEKNEELTLSHLLNILDGTLTREDMIFIATTNYIDKLDSALKRPGRFDISIHLSECDEYQLSVIYNKLLQKEISKESLDLLSTKSITPAKFIYGLIPYIGRLEDEYNEEEIVKTFLE